MCGVIDSFWILTGCKAFLFQLKHDAHRRRRKDLCQHQNGRNDYIQMMVWKDILYICLLLVLITLDGSQKPNIITPHFQSLFETKTTIRQHHLHNPFIPCKSFSRAFSHTKSQTHNQILAIFLRQSLICRFRIYASFSIYCRNGIETFYLS